MTASRSFWDGMFLVEPLGFNMLFVRVACSVANRGLLRSTDSSIGGSIVMLLWLFC